MNSLTSSKSTVIDDHQSQSQSQPLSSLSASPDSSTSASANTSSLNSNTPPNTLDITSTPVVITKTPPSTPLTGQSSSTTSTAEMLALTQAKLERAAQGHVSGRRGAGGLRELVLLSNVFGQASPQWTQEQLDKERELREIEQRRKEDEERWLDGVLDEMLEEGDDEDEDFVAIYVADPTVSDSGFLEQGAIGPEGASRHSSTSGDLGDRLDGIKEEDSSPHSAHTSLTSDSPSNEDVHTSSPIPPLSPPINVPLSQHQSLTLEDDYSCSPPLDPPPLTPDSTPPTRSSALDVLGTSVESVDTEIDSFQWISDRSAQRGLLALDLSRPKPKPSFAVLDSSSNLSTHLDLVSLTLRDRSSNPHTSSRASGESTWPSTSSRPPRSLSVPNLTLRNLSPPSTPARPLSPPFPSYPSGGIVKSFYDCVDFGRPPSPDLSEDYPPTASLPSDSFIIRGRPSESLGVADSLSLVLAQPRPLSAHSFGELANAAEWRARSISPESRRPAWARLSDVGEVDTDIN